MNLSYERASTPRPTYTIRLDGKAVGTVSRTKGGQWIANPTTLAGAARVSVPACETRHEATMALLGELTEANLL